MHSTSPEHPLDALASFATRLIPSRTENPARVASKLARPFFGAPNPPAAPVQLAAPTYGGTPDGEYRSGAGAQVQPQGYGPSFTGSVNMRAPQTPGGTATAGPYNGQDFQPAGTQHPPQPAPPVHQPQIQAPTVSFLVNYEKWTKAGYDEVGERLEDSPEIQNVTPLRPSHAPGAPLNQSTYDTGPPPQDSVKQIPIR